MNKKIICIKILNNEFKTKVIDGIRRYCNKKEIKANFSYTDFITGTDYESSTLNWNVVVNNIKYIIETCPAKKLIKIEINLERKDANNINFNVPDEILEVDNKIVKLIKKYGKEYNKQLTEEVNKIETKTEPG